MQNIGIVPVFTRAVVDRQRGLDSTATPDSDEDCNMLNNSHLQRFIRTTASCGLALIAGLLVNLPAQAQDDANWEITITYHDQDQEAAPVFEKNGLTYEQAYNSIPFNRTEYNANPSYRHDSAMEFLFNEMRPTTVIRGESQPSRYPTFNYPDFMWSHPYYYNTRGYYYFGY